MHGAMHGATYSLSRGIMGQSSNEYLNAGVYDRLGKDGGSSP